jgi:nucleoside-diphosphate-sugar epimerase
MKILIIGAQFTGYAAAKYWRKQGHTITATTTREARVEELKKVADNVVVMRGSDEAKMRATLPGHDVVLMSVAGGMVEKDGKVVMDPDAYKDTYLGTAQNLTNALQNAPSVKCVIFPSSTSAYGDAHGIEIADETTPVNAQSIFQKVYVDTENVLLNSTLAQRAICILRTGNIYGPGRELVLQAKAMAGNKVPLDGEAGAMVVHRDDVVLACELALKKNLNGIFNVVNEVTLSKKDFFAQVCERENLAPIEWTPFAKGVKQISNKKIKDQGFRFLDPQAKRDKEDLIVTTGSTISWKVR